MGAFLNAVKRLWNDKCDIFSYVLSEDENGEEYYQKVLIYSNIQCGLSFENSPRTTDGEYVAKVEQIVTLHISNEYEIKENSDISVTRNGRIIEYKNSGSPEIYPEHQVITLKLKKEVA